MNWSEVESNTNVLLFLEVTKLFYHEKQIHKNVMVYISSYYFFIYFVINCKIIYAEKYVQHGLFGRINSNFDVIKPITIF